MSLHIEVQLNGLGKAMKKHLAVLMAGLAVLLFAATASAQSSVFVGNMLPGNEIPPLDTGMGGLCVASVVVNDDGSSTALVIMSAYGNDTRITASHIHIGAADVAGPVICPLFTTGEWTNPVIGTCEFSVDQTTELFNGNLYCNVHTMAHGGGEIRDQLNFVQ